MPVASSLEMGVASLVISAGPVVKFVLLVLFLLSIVCWGIILLKAIGIRRAEKESLEFIEIFRKSKSIDETFTAVRGYKNSPAAMVFRAGYSELMKTVRRTGNGTIPFSASSIDLVDRSLRKAESAETALMERHLNFLATTGSAAPFIGLFGTVWGIMNSFQRIGVMGTANLAVVAPGVSEALIATALGLAAAIPAVIFYNIFTDKIRRLSNETDNLILEFLNIAEREIRRQRDERR